MGKFKKRPIAPDGTKTCSICLIAKQTSEFKANALAKTGISSICKPCARDRAKIYMDRVMARPGAREKKRLVDAIARNKNGALERRRAVIAANCSARAKAEAALWHRNNHLKKKYGITLEERDRIVASQGGRCAICLTENPGGKGRRLGIDHDHSDGRIRGALCNNCNRGIGHLKDSVASLRAAIEYLEASNLEAVYKSIASRADIGLTYGSGVTCR